MERLHRFGAYVKVHGRKEYCHVTNSGRLKELLYPGARVALVDHGQRSRMGSEKRKSERKTRYAIRLAAYRGKWVCIEANIAPRLVEEAWRRGSLGPLKGYDQLQAEVPLNQHTRFDFKAWNSKTGAQAWVEVKCVTLVDSKGIARFPDAPSERASKHLRELMVQSKKHQTRCLVFFVLQNALGRAVSPNDGTDPRFGETLRAASKTGVGLKAFRARIGLKSGTLTGPIPVLL